MEEVELTAIDTIVEEQNNEKNVKLAKITQKEKDIFNKLLPDVKFSRATGYMCSNYKYGNIQMCFNGKYWIKSYLVCMPGQCSTCILQHINNTTLKYLDEIEKLAKFYLYTKIVVTDNKQRQVLLDNGYKLYDQLKNKRTGSIIYFYSKCF